MADIKKELNGIKNAVYGREVRGSIHDGIKKINDEVENAANLSKSAKHQVENIQQQVNQLVVEGDSSVEAAQARVDADGNTFTTLKERLDTKETQFTSQLAQIDEQVYKNALFPLGIKTYDGSNQTTHPDVKYFPNRWNGYHFWMVHTPYPFNDKTKENPSIAVSNDGVYWYEPEGIVNPIDEPTQDELAVGGFNADGVIVMNGNTMEVWWKYQADSQNVEMLYRKKSTDGVNWSEREAVFRAGVDSIQPEVISPTVIYENGRYRMWYVSYPTPDKVGARKMWYTESTTGNSNWSTPVEVPINWKQGEEPLSPWHINVTREGDKLNLIVNTERARGVGRTLAWATSSDGLSFNDCKRILEPSVRGWDNGNLYRASLVYIERNNYILYYSARTTDSYWQIGALAGSAIDRLRPLIPINRYGNLILNKILVNELDYRQNKFALLNKLSYFSNEEIKFSTPGVKSAKIKNTDVDTLEALRADDSEGIIFKSDEMESRVTRTTQIRPRDPFGFRFYGTTRIGSVIEEVDGKLLLERANGHGAGFIVYSDEPDTLELVRRNGASGGSLRLAQLILTGSIPAMEVEGAIRYSRGQKKLQFYNGERWETVESS